jgi:CheY-like chemotaxis protein
LDAAPDEQQVSGEFLRPTPTDFAMRSLTTTPPPPGVSAAAAPSDGEQAAVKPQLKRVLLVDDVTSNLKMATRLLMRGGVEMCEQAVDGQDAISKYLAARERVDQEARLAAQQQLLEGGGEVQTTGKENGASVQQVEPFDAILMDFEMPVMNGPTATAKLREMGCTAPIIGITGNVLPQDIKLFLNSGATAVLPKPLKFAELEALWRSGGEK